MIAVGSSITFSTTSSTGWSNSVRGSEHWLAYVNIGEQAWWPAAHQLATAPVLILTTGLVAAMGLVGLCHHAMPLRGPLLASAVLGLLCLTAASPALLGSLVDGPVRDLLDGVLAPLRNVHKVDPVVRLPLALGVAHFTAILPVLTRRLAPPWTTMAASIRLCSGHKRTPCDDKPSGHVRIRSIGSTAFTTSRIVTCSAGPTSLGPCSLKCLRPSVPTKPARAPCQAAASRGLTLCDCCRSEGR